ncbi:hypothetical protein [Moorena bouillonii]|nr:hypothetical protein [Moorena bouillonii]
MALSTYNEMNILAASSGVSLHDCSHPKRFAIVPQYPARVVVHRHSKLRGIRPKELEEGLQMENRYKVGLLIICTGKYHRFMEGLYESASKFFMNNHDVTYFFFSDQDDMKQYQNMKIIKIPHLPWPLIALMRYHFFDQYRAVLSDMDFLFCCDVDMRFVSLCGDEILPNTSSGLVGVDHPGYCLMPRLKSKFDRLLENHLLKKIGITPRITNKRLRGTYETNPISTAYIAPDQGEVYYAGAFNGGRTDAFLTMCDHIKQNVNQDLSKNYIAVWHDESHLNRYFINHPPKTLSPSYCYPESWNLPFPKILLALDKNHHEIRR